MKNHAWQACACALLLIAGAAGSAAQNSASRSQRNPTGLASAPLADGGFSYYTAFTETHDASAGWTTELDSSLRYDFSKQFAMEGGIPFYFGQPPAVSTTTTTTTTTGRGPATTQTSAQGQSLSYGAVGDFFLDGQMTRKSDAVNYQGQLTVTAPTGSTLHGVSTGRPTFDWNNHLEREFWHLTPFVEAGLGDSVGNLSLGPGQGRGAAGRSLLPYTTLGMESHFQLGSSIDVADNLSLGLNAYDISPFGDQKVYSRIVSRKAGQIAGAGRGNHGRAFEVAALVSGPASIAADHGFGGSFSFNPTPRMDVEVGYQRSVNYALNTVTMTVGYRIGHLPPKKGKAQ